MVGNELFRSRLGLTNGNQCTKEGISQIRYQEHEVDRDEAEHKN